VKFILEVDLDKIDGDTGKELSRILRYWAGAVPQMELIEGAGTGIYDSVYHEVGYWAVKPASTASPA
jgi:hypothetical protein